MAEDKKEVEIIQVPTQTASAFKLPDGRVLNFDEYLTWIGNILIKLEKVWSK
ncbi:MAG: hypothetical protein ABSG05_03450 [Candidatus Pacearchaeota archaeon]|jgi:hypothetical protein